MLCCAACRQWRVIFDEGHVLKSKTSIQARAACSLASDRRWVVTGTPIDSEVMDIHGLLLALQVSRGAAQVDAWLLVVDAAVRIALLQDAD